MTSTQNYRPNPTRQHLQLYPYSAHIDTDELQEPPSLSPSPTSQYSVIPHSGPGPHTAFSAPGGVPAIAIPRTAEANIGDISLRLGEHSELMNTGNWDRSGRKLLPNQQRGATHNRESSLSSMGSAGPRSPYNTNVANPRIAVADSGHDGLHGLHDGSQDGLWDNNYGVFSKSSMGGHAPDNFFSALPPDGGLDNHGNHGMPYSMQSVVGQRHQSERGGLGPPVDFNAVLSRPGADSVASSTIGGDSPATPAMGEPVEDRRRNEGLHEPPKLDRTMTDTYRDVGFIPNFAVTSSPSQQQHFSPSAPFTRAIEAANIQHLNVDHSPVGVGFRGSSPFRNGSPLAPTSSRDFGQASHFNAVAQRPGQLHHVSPHESSPSTGGQATTPQTISPKDSILEYDDDDADGHFSPLFHQQQGAGGFSDVDQLMQATTHQIPHSASAPLPYMNAPAANEMRVPQAYPFIAAPPRPAEGASGELVLAPQASQEMTGPPAGRGIIEDGGTYSCTYHGCDRRFDTQKDLQTHKREGHRAVGASRRGERGSQQQTQQGPHTCTRVNPSTGKVCGSKFSRPYDLTRHEDTIHNARKRKVRCDICTEEKLFSRRDALSRHFKVCHEELFEERFGKSRRRRG